MPNGFAYPTFRAPALDYRGTITGAAAPLGGLMGGLQKGLEMRQQLQEMQAAEQERKIAMQQAEQAAAQEEQLNALRMQAARGDPAAQQQIMALDPEGALRMQQVSAKAEERQIKSEEAARNRIGSTGAMMTAASEDNVRAVYNRALNRIRKEGDDETEFGLPAREEATDMTDKELLAAVKSTGRLFESIGLGPQQEKAPLVQVGVPGAPQYKVPTGYMLKDPTDPEKGVQPIPGTKLEQEMKTRKFTEAQSTSANYANRMVEADKAMEELMAEGVTGAEAGPAIAQMVPFVGGYLTPELHQVLRQAQDDWIRAKLRKESGAVIGADEMEQERRTYFPMPGDNKKTIEAKKKARERATSGMKAQSGGAYKSLFEEMTEEEREAPADGDISKLSDEELLRMLGGA